MTRQETIEKATNWMEEIAKDPKHGYDQTYRWGQKGDYDCSAAVITAWDKAGVDLKNDGEDKTGIWPKKGGVNTSWDIGSGLLKNGFKDISDKVNFRTGEGLKRGDVLVAKGHHVAMYCGDGKEVEASINEKRTATGGKPGDQTGREFLIRSYRNYPWTNIYRYEGGVVEEKVVKKIDKADTRSFNDHTHFEVIAKNGLNVRKAPGAAIVTAIPYKSQVSFDDDQKAIKGWRAIDKCKVPGGEWKKLKGYCSAKYLKEV